MDSPENVVFTLIVRFLFLMLKILDLQRKYPLFKHCVISMCFKLIITLVLTREEKSVERSPHLMRSLLFSSKPSPILVHNKFLTWLLNYFKWPNSVWNLFECPSSQFPPLINQYNKRILLVDILTHFFFSEWLNFCSSLRKAQRKGEIILLLKFMVAATQIVVVRFWG